MVTYVIASKATQPFLPEVSKQLLKNPLQPLNSTFYAAVLNAGRIPVRELPRRHSLGRHQVQRGLGRIHRRCKFYKIVSRNYSGRSKKGVCDLTVTFMCVGIQVCRSYGFYERYCPFIYTLEGEPIGDGADFIEHVRNRYCRASVSIVKEHQDNR